MLPCFRRALKRWIEKEDVLVQEGKKPTDAWPKLEAELFQKEYFKAASALGSAFLVQLETEVNKMADTKGINIGVVGRDLREEATKAAGAMKGEVSLCLILLLLCIFVGESSFGTISTICDFVACRNLDTIATV